jgi:hypothetical protein
MPAIWSGRRRAKDRVQRWLAAGKNGQVGAMLVRTEQPKALEVLAETVL